MKPTKTTSTETVWRIKRDRYTFAFWKAHIGGLTVNIYDDAASTGTDDLIGMFDDKIARGLARYFNLRTVSDQPLVDQSTEIVSMLDAVAAAKAQRDRLAAEPTNRPRPTLVDGVWRFPLGSNTN